MKLGEFVDAIRKGFKGRAPKGRKLHAIYSLFVLPPELKWEQIQFQSNYPFWYSVYDYSPSK